MDQHLILTAIGTDRAGLVDDVSQFIFERGGNIEDSRMVNLRGQFAVMVLIAGASHNIDKIRDDLPTLRQRTGLHVELCPAGPESVTPSAQAIPYRLTATAIDQPGLVHRISHLLRANNANIESLETHRRPAPITGAPMFEMGILISVPRTLSISKLRQELGKTCDELNIDWQLATA